MAQEIERKFLVNQDLWTPQVPGVAYRQGYIRTQAPGSTVRIRIQGDEGRITLKGPTTGWTRAEYEYPIPLADAVEMLDTLCDPPLIEKVRYQIPWGGLVWEVDVFAGDNQGLITAEVELESEDQTFESPLWLGPEVSHDYRYSNSQLAQRPYRSWER